MTKREQIVQAIMLALNGTDGVADRIFRSRQQAIDRDEVPAIIVTYDTEEPTQVVSTYVEKKLNVRVEVYNRGQSADSDADYIVESMHSKMMADSTFGGLAIDLIENGTGLEQSDADQEALIISVHYIVWYRHLRENLAL